MAIRGGPACVTNGLVQDYDASSTKSYTGFGASWVDLVSGTAFTSFTPTAFQSGNAINFSGAAAGTTVFSFAPSNTIEFFYKTYTTGSNGGQFLNPPILKIGNYASACSMILWDNTTAALDSGHDIKTYIDNPNVWYSINSSPVGYTDAQWLQYHQIAMIFTGGAAGNWSGYNLYVDGQLQYNVNFAPFGFPSGAQTIAGGNNLIISQTNGGLLNNNYSILRVYNRALSLGELQQNRDAVRTRFGQ